MSRLRDVFGRKGRRPAVETEAGAALETESTRPCPHCGEPISRGATVCLHCERDVTAVMQAGQFVQLFGSPGRDSEDGDSQ